MSKSDRLASHPTNQSTARAYYIRLGDVNGGSHP